MDRPGISQQKNMRSVSLQHLAGLINRGSGHLATLAMYCGECFSRLIPRIYASYVPKKSGVEQAFVLTQEQVQAMRSCMVKLVLLGMR